MNACSVFNYTLYCLLFATHIAYKNTEALTEAVCPLSRHRPSLRQPQRKFGQAKRGMI
ncbi:hypothetical protein HMPREF3201_01161 [Megasphaera sp. MJR8396C]|nr:hypothetical protein HMPREF3201_01161 [Megasphaera sp. MJR8396C]